MMKTFDDIWPMMQSLWPHADLGGWTRAPGSISGAPCEVQARSS